MSFLNDELSGLVMAAEPGLTGPIEDFDLHILDDAAAPTTSAAALERSGFDLDDLLANGPTSADRDAAHSLDLDLALDRPADRPAMLEVAEELVKAMPIQEREPEVGPPAASVPAPLATAVSVAASSPVAAAVKVARSPALAIAITNAPEVRGPAKAATKPAPIVTTELPLFMQGMSSASLSTSTDAEQVADAIERTETNTPGPAVVEEFDDRPLVQLPAVPRAPLAVRRATPDPARLRAKYARANRTADTSGDLLQGIDEPAGPVEPGRTVARMSAEPTPESLPAGWLKGVSMGKRLSAALVDLVLLGGINALIVWFTLGVCGLAPAQVSLLPAIPIGVFLLLIDGGYLVLFTAACGQTVGKMLTGIRVVGTSADSVINDRLTLSQSIARSVGVCGSLGLGLLMSLGGDGRAMHDRLAHTRVVRA